MRRPEKQLLACSDANIAFRFSSCSSG
jgi:hypothetical protein